MSQSPTVASLARRIEGSGGGNTDAKETVVSTTLLFLCFIDGCGIFAGDVHFAKGGDEVAGTAIDRCQGDASGQGDPGRSAAADDHALRRRRAAQETGTIELLRGLGAVASGVAACSQ